VLACTHNIVARTRTALTELDMLGNWDIVRARVVEEKSALRRNFRGGARCPY
jgi:hypothetical protein